MLTLDRVPARTRPTPTAELPALPTTPAGRAELFSQAVFAAVAALQKQLTDDDPAVVRAAAESILDLEKTRLRHGREVAGMECGPHTPCAVLPEPHTACADHTPDESAAEQARRSRREFIEELRRALQTREDELGSGVVVTPEQAEAFYRQVKDRVRAGYDPRGPTAGG